MPITAALPRSRRSENRIRGWSRQPVCQREVLAVHSLPFMNRRGIHILLCLLLVLLSCMERTVPCTALCEEVSHCAETSDSSTANDRHEHDAQEDEACVSCYCPCKPLVTLDLQHETDRAVELSGFALLNTGHPTWMPPSPPDHIPLV